MNHDRIMRKAKRMKAIIPRQGSQCHELLEAFFDGKKLTVLKALKSHGVYALSQRCSELRLKYRWPIKGRMVTLPNGKKVAEYSL